MLDDRPEYCPHCRAPVSDHGPYCSSCGGDLFGPAGAGHDFEQGAPPVRTRSRNDRVEDVADVSWVCLDCGRHHPRNNPPCKNCGGMDFETVEHTADARRPTSDGAGATTSQQEDLLPGSSRGGQVMTGLALFSTLVGTWVSLLLGAVFGILFGWAATRYGVRAWSERGAYAAIVLGTVEIFGWLWLVTS